MEPINENGIFKSEANIIQLRVQEMTRTKVKIMLKQHKNKTQNPLGLFKYYVSKEVGGWGQKMAIYAEVGGWD